MIKKIIRHLKAKTFVKALKRKLQGLVAQGTPPIGNEYYGDVASNYLDHRDDQIFWDKELLVLEDAIKGIIITNNTKRILDVPFGTGRFVNLYLDNKFQIYGLDSSKDMIDVAKQHLDKKFKQCKVCVGFSTNMPYKKKYFDLLICYRFLPWVISYKDVAITLQEFNRVLKVNGYALLEFSVNRSDSIYNSVDNLNKNSIMWDKFTSNQINQLLNEHGFKVEREIFIFNDIENPNITLFVCKKTKTLAI
jgi:ubiquinone/menaquinone biosynthesis C-methylase UbiE